MQAETYRRMKRATKNRWAAHVPATNVFWMQYLVDICLTEVSPPPRLTTCVQNWGVRALPAWQAAAVLARRGTWAAAL